MDRVTSYLSWVGLTRKKIGSGRVIGQSVFTSDKKNHVQVRYFQVGSGQVGSENSDPYCHVYL